MNKEKVLDMLLNGDITKEAAMMLLSDDCKSSNEIKVSQKMKFKTKDELIDDAYNDIEPEYEFKVDEIVEYMNKVNWHWFDCTKMTAEHFLKELKRLIKECVNGMLNEGKEQYTIATGGLEVSSYFLEDDDDYIEVEFKFIMDNGYIGFHEKDWKNAMED